MTTQALRPARGASRWAPVVTSGDWFEVRDLGSDVYLIAEPGHVNCFLVLGDDAALLFDTGMGIGLISDVVAGLTDRPLIVVNSHDHLDHRGGNSDLFQRRRELGLIDIAAHPHGVRHGHDAVPERFLAEYETAMRGVYTDYLAYMALDSQRFYACGRLPRMRAVPGLASWHVPAVRPTRALDDGELLDLGGRSLTVLHAPGHAPDGICLFEPSTGMLLAGDMVLAAAHWLHGDGADLGAFASSTQRLAALPVSRVLTAHNLLAEIPADQVAAVVRAARVVLDGESIPKPGTDLLGHPARRH
ncbi:MBL fold metallo-hydrolase, partial [Phytoactinopolyspora endophytica]|uniref:MBL fold metallo-hydrolase n=1 Tax=Phytoactinopolyspora endophytica TaxID=1642495 RepID=UPI00101CBE3C